MTNSLALDAFLISGTLFFFIAVVTCLLLWQRWENEAEDTVSLSKDELTDPLRPDPSEADPSDWWKYNKDKHD